MKINNNTVETALLSSKPERFPYEYFIFINLYD